MIFTSQYRDSLPKEVTTPLEKALVRELNASQLSCAFKAAMDALLIEIREVDMELCIRLEETLKDIPSFCEMYNY